MLNNLISLSLFLLFVCSCHHDAERYAIKGIDVSHYQKKIDWERVGHQNLKFVFIKATEGLNYQDATFTRNWTASKKNNLLRGVYHFFRPNVSVEWQAKNFIRTVHLEKGDLPPVLDVEDLEDRELPRVAENIRKWLILIEHHYHTPPIIYTSLHLYQKYFKAAFPEYVFWIARYNRQAPPLGEKALFWQYSQTGKVRGIPGHVDLDVFAGSQRQLQNLTIP